MHNGPALEGIEATLGTGLPLVAALDTAFHASLPPRAWRYALPDLDGVRRYGFHGWSHRYVTNAMPSSPGHPSPPSSRFTWEGAAQPLPFFAGARWTPRWDTRHSRAS